MTDLDERNVESQQRNVQSQSWRFAGGAAGAPAMDRTLFERTAVDRDDALWCRTAGRLQNLINLEIIPRLLLAAATAPAAGGARPTSLDEAVITEFVELALEADADALSRRIAELQSCDVTIEAIFLDLLTPVARRLGELWEDDRCHFTDVTIGLMRLQQVLRRLSPDFQSELAPHVPGRRDLGHRVLLLPTARDQHNFGLSMIAEFFHRAGWNVSGGAALSARQLERQVADMEFAVVGFSVSCESRLDSLAGEIRRLRRASANAQVGVMVGGPLFVTRPDLVARVGADTTAADGREAVRQAHRLVALMQRRQ